MSWKRCSRIYELQTKGGQIGSLVDKIEESFNFTLRRNNENVLGWQKPDSFIRDSYGAIRFIGEPDMVQMADEMIPD
jgi:hypothetical protein